MEAGTGNAGADLIDMVDSSVRVRLQRSLARHSTASLAAFMITSGAALLPVFTTIAPASGDE